MTEKEFTELKREVCAYFDVDCCLLESASRLKKVKYARFTIYNIFRYMGLSFPQIGKRVNRDHATVQHGIKVSKNNKEIKALAWELAEKYGKHEIQVINYDLILERYKKKIINLKNDGLDLDDISKIVGIKYKFLVAFFFELGKKGLFRPVPNYKTNKIEKKWFLE